MMGGLIQQPVHHLRSRIVHCCGKQLDSADKIVVRDHRGNSHEQAGGCCHERFGYPGLHRTQPTGSCLGDRLEGPNDPQNGPEEADKRADIAEGRQ